MDIMLITVLIVVAITFIAIAIDIYSHKQKDLRPTQHKASASVGVADIDIEVFTFEPYEDKAGEFRWRLIAPNGRIIADSAQGYEDEDFMLTMIAKIQRKAAGALVVDTVYRTK